MARRKAKPKPFTTENTEVTEKTQRHFISQRSLRGSLRSLRLKGFLQAVVSAAPA